ncbi:MAG: DUF501 domain-containing protein [Spirochaetes bacterium]|nr:MAG: DUF501 domain-containing protein [Spirochaetota bacterium]
MSSNQITDCMNEIKPERFPSTPRDERVIRWQLGRDDIFLGGVVERCDYGFPRIMLLNPLPSDETRGGVRYEAVTNIIWLTCPFLNECIHELEQEGYIEKVSALIGGDLELRTKMEAAHARFYYLRKNFYKRYFGTAPEEDRASVFNVGIAGIRDIGAIKCLHAHFAHFRICDDNVAGVITSRLLNDKINCDEVRCRNAG